MDIRLTLPPDLLAGMDHPGSADEVLTLLRTGIGRRAALRKAANKRGTLEEARASGKPLGVREARQLLRADMRANPGVKKATKKAAPKKATKKAAPKKAAKKAAPKKGGAK